MSNPTDQSRRGFLGSAALALAASQYALATSAAAETRCEASHRRHPVGDRGLVRAR